MFSISNKHEEFFDYLIENAENFHRGTLIAKDQHGQYFHVHEGYRPAGAHVG